MARRIAAECKPPGGVALVSHMRCSRFLRSAAGAAFFTGAGAVSAMAGAAALGACGTAGALHQATLAGQCAAEDAACSRRHPQAPIAIGTRFYPEVSTELAGTTTPSLRLESAAPDIIAVEDGALVARRPGTSAVLITTDDGSVVDFMQVWAAPVTQITLARRDGDRIAGALALAVGEDVTLVPALWNAAQRLSGDGGVVWTLAAAGPIAMLRDGSADRRRLRARAPGTTTVIARLGAITATLDVEVVP